MKKHYRHENDCLNCGHTLTEGKFCPHCGQENLNLEEPFWHFIGHSVGHYFHFDSKFFHTIVPLLTKPGQLPIDFIVGKRTRFVHPVSMYIFVSIVYFLIVSVTTTHEENADKNSTHKTHLSADSISKIKRRVKNETEGLPASSVVQLAVDKALQNVSEEDFKALSYNNQAKILDSLKALNHQKTDEKLNDRITDFEDVHIQKSDSTYAAFLNRQSKLPTDERDGWFKRFIKKREISIQERTSKEWSLKKELEHYTPKLYFILMPLFAFFLMLNLRKNHKYYLEHMIFTIYLFTAFFILKIVTRPIDHFLLNDNSGIFGIIVFGVVVWYVYRSLRVFYRRSKWVTIRKMLSLSFLLMIAFGISYSIIYVIIYAMA